MVEVLFPLLRPGGWYVIEDWQWAHSPGFTDPTGYLTGQRGLSNLVVRGVDRCR